MELDTLGVLEAESRKARHLCLGKEMPLITTGEPGTANGDRKAIGFRMTIEGKAPVESVGVLVSYEALWEMEPSKPRDVIGAAEIFDAKRKRIESVASARYGEDGINPADGPFEGMPVLILWSVDF